MAVRPLGARLCQTRGARNLDAIPLAETMGYGFSLLPLYPDGSYRKGVWAAIVCPLTTLPTPLGPPTRFLTRGKYFSTNSSAAVESKCADSPSNTSLKYPGPICSFIILKSQNFCHKSTVNFSV
jgi:hypothetical protein